ncbi:MAG: GNAT family N-acetyltransferase [Luteimonas sp.]
MDTILTARILLRPLAAEDEALYRTIYCDPILMRHVAEPLSVEEANASFAIALRQTMASAPVNWWTIADRISLQGIGLLGANPTEDAFEVGVMLLASDQGHGYATEAITSLAYYLFDCHGAAAIVMQHALDNAAMRGLMLRLGFENASTDGSQTVWRLERAMPDTVVEPPAAFALPNRAR